MVVSERQRYASASDRGNRGVRGAHHQDRMAHQRIRTTWRNRTPPRRTRRRDQRAGRADCGEKPRGTRHHSRSRRCCPRQERNLNMTTKTTKTIRKPAPLRTKNLSASCHIDRNRVVIQITDRASWQDMGISPPSDGELEKLCSWVRKVRAYRNNRNRKS